MTAKDTLAKILGVETMFLEHLDSEMAKRIGKKGTLDSLVEKNSAAMERTLSILDSKNRGATHVKSVLRQTLLGHEKYLLGAVERENQKNEFEGAAKLARQIASVGKGFFLKKEFAREILEKRNPENLLNYLGFSSVSEALQKHDVTELFSALRFIETDEWMHETFEVAYNNFTAKDFEEREIQIEVLGPEWKAVSEKFVAKKHHNVSHLKEFGVIFLNPIRENMPGKFLRDFALLLHYFHEIDFYSKLFKKYSQEENFAENFKKLLRGDVPEIYRAEPGTWLIIQRYLAKENPKDPRLFLPRANPESMHWARGERDFTLSDAFHSATSKIDLRIWCDLDWVGGIFEDGGEVVSFDLEDNAMSLVSFMEGKGESFNYHQKESMWTKIFEEYVGGESKMEELLVQNFNKGIITF